MNIWKLQRNFPDFTNVHFMMLIYNFKLLVSVFVYLEKCVYKMNLRGEENKNNISRHSEAIRKLNILE